MAVSDTPTQAKIPSVFSNRYILLPFRKELFSTIEQSVYVEPATKNQYKHST